MNPNMNIGQVSSYRDNILVEEYTDYGVSECSQEALYCENKIALHALPLMPQGVCQHRKF